MPNIQVCQVVMARYSPDAARSREPYRDEHLARLEKLFEQGALVTAGAFDDLSASLLVLAVETEEAAEAVVKTDVYYKNGIWTDYEIKKMNRVSFDG